MIGRQVLASVIRLAFFRARHLCVSSCNFFFKLSKLSPDSSSSSADSSESKLGSFMSSSVTSISTSPSSSAKLMACCKIRSTNKTCYIPYDKG